MNGNCINMKYHSRRNARVSVRFTPSEFFPDGFVNDYCWECFIDVVNINKDRIDSVARYKETKESQSDE